MKRRNFITGLLSLAAAPLAMRAIAEPKSVSTLTSGLPELGLDASTIKRVEAQLSGKNARPFKGRHYDFWLIDDLVNNEAALTELEATGFRVNYDALHQMMSELSERAGMTCKLIERNV